MSPATSFSQFESREPASNSIDIKDISLGAIIPPRLLTEQELEQLRGFSFEEIVELAFSDLSLPFDTRPSPSSSPSPSPSASFSNTTTSSSSPSNPLLSLSSITLNSSSPSTSKDTNIKKSKIPTPSQNKVATGRISKAKGKAKAKLSAPVHSSFLQEFFDDEEMEEFRKIECDQELMEDFMLGF